MGRGGSRAYVNGSGASLRQVTLVTRPLCSTSDAGLRAKVGQECAYVCVCVRRVEGEVCRCLLSTIHYDY